MARRVDAPVAGEVGLTLARLGTRLREAIEGHGSLERGLAVLRRSLLAGLAGGDVDRLVFVGFRVAYVVAAALFGVMFAADTGSVGFWLLLAAFLLVVYAGLLPLMAADIYLVRTAPGSRTPTWRYLASFLLAPLALAVGAVYWYRRPAGGADGS